MMLPREFGGEVARFARPLVRSAIALVLVVAPAGLRATAALADDQPCPPPGGSPAYSVALRAPTGPKGADLALTVDRATQSGCAIPAAFKKIQMKLFALGGGLASTRNLSDVSADGGNVDLALGAVGRGQPVEVELLLASRRSERSTVGS